MRFAISLLAAAMALPPAQAGAMEVLRLEVSEHERAYVVEFDARLAAPAPAVMAVLTDYARYPELDPRILEARRLPDRDGRPVLYTRLRGCVGSVFCRSMDRYEWLDEGRGRFVATAIPGEGDLLRGETVTRVVPDAGGARVSYRTEFEPSFWMPRWLVRGAMHATLREGTQEMFARIERRAAGLP